MHLTLAAGEADSDSTADVHASVAGYTVTGTSIILWSKRRIEKET